MTAQKGGAFAKRDLTEGSIIGNILYMGVPSMIGFAAMVIYELTDMFWVARLGTAQVAAVTLFASFAWVISSINSLVGSGSVPVISRRFGEKDLAGTESAIEQTLAMKFMIGLPMGIAGFFLARPILSFMTHEADVIDLGTEYGRIFFLGLPFMFTSYTIYTALRGIGDAPRAMHIMLVSTGLNMVLDPIFIIWLDLGIAGAAIATVISAVTAVGIGIWILTSGKEQVRIGRRGFRFDWSVMRKILEVGFPPFVESIARSIAFWLLAVFVATYGKVIVASYGICTRIVEFGIVFAIGLEMGSSAIVGQNLGAGKPERAELTAKKSALLALGVALVLSAIELAFGKQIMHIFGKSPEVKMKGAEVLFYFALSQPFVAAAIGLSSAFYGSGNTWPPTITGLLTSWLFQIPLTAIFVYILNYTPRAIWIVMILGNIFYLSILLVWFKRGRWKLRKI